MCAAPSHPLYALNVDCLKYLYSYLNVRDLAYLHATFDKSVQFFFHQPGFCEELQVHDVGELGFEELYFMNQLPAVSKLVIDRRKVPKAPLLTVLEYLAERHCQTLKILYTESPILLGQGKVAKRKITRSRAYIQTLANTTYAAAPDQLTLLPLKEIFPNLQELKWIGNTGRSLMTEQREWMHAPDLKTFYSSMPSYLKRFTHTADWITLEDEHILLLPRTITALELSSIDSAPHDFSAIEHHFPLLDRLMMSICAGTIAFDRNKPLLPNLRHLFLSIGGLEKDKPKLPFPPNLESLSLEGHVGDMDEYLPIADVFESDPVTRELTLPPLLKSLELRKVCLRAQFYNTPAFTYEYDNIDQEDDFNPSVYDDPNFEPPGKVIQKGQIVPFSVAFLPPSLTNLAALATDVLIDGGFEQLLSPLKNLKRLLVDRTHHGQFFEGSLRHFNWQLLPPSVHTIVTDFWPVPHDAKTLPPQVRRLEFVQYSNKMPLDPNVAAAFAQSRPQQSWILLKPLPLFELSSALHSICYFDYDPDVQE